MTLEEQVALNQFGQGVRSIESLLLHFSQLSEVNKRDYLTYLSGLIWQSKPVEADIEQAIIDSLLNQNHSLILSGAIEHVCNIFQWHVRPLQKCQIVTIGFDNAL